MIKTKAPTKSIIEYWHVGTDFGTVLRLGTAESENELRQHYWKIMPNSIGLKSDRKTYPVYRDFSLNPGVQELTADSISK